MRVTHVECARPSLVAWLAPAHAGSMSTHEKLWFLTGASRGFGRLWTEAALRRGDRVAATARDIGSLDELVATHGDAILPLKLDVTDRDAVFDAVRRAADHFGRIDVVVNN